MSDRITTAEDVFMENELRSIFNENMPKVKAILAPYIGQRIYKADNQLLKKIKDQIVFDYKTPVVPLRRGGFANLHYAVVKTSAYSIWLEISLCFNGGKYEDNSHYCQYKSNSWYIGEVNIGVLTAVFGELLSPISNEKEEKNLQRAKRLKQEYEAVLSLLLPSTKEANYLK